MYLQPKKSSWSLGNLCNHDLFESHYTGQIEAALISPQVLKTIQYAIIIYIQIILNIKHRYMNQYLTLYKSKSKLSWSTLHRGGRHHLHETALKISVPDGSKWPGTMMFEIDLDAESYIWDDWCQLKTECVPYIWYKCTNIVINLMANSGQCWGRDHL